jgi:hypothetical protein
MVTFENDLIPSYRGTNKELDKLTLGILDLLQTRARATLRARSRKRSSSNLLFSTGRFAFLAQRTVRSNLTDDLS